MEDYYISGLTYIPDFIDADVEEELFQQLDHGVHPWENKLKRRTSQFGTEYNYTSKQKIPLLERPVTGVIKEIADRLQETYGVEFTDVICNEYMRDQGITAHTDSKVFGDTVIGISIGSGATIVFAHKDGRKIELWLEPRSAFIMTGEVRYEWTHSIPARINMNMNGTNVKRGADFRRVSITYRN